MGRGTGKNRNDKSVVVSVNVKINFQNDPER